MRDRGYKMNDELLCRDFKSLSLVQEDCFLGGYIWARLLSSRMQSERCRIIIIIEQLLGSEQQRDKHMCFS